MAVQKFRTKKSKMRAADVVSGVYQAMEKGILHKSADDKKASSQRWSGQKFDLAALLLTDTQETASSPSTMTLGPNSVHICGTVLVSQDDEHTTTNIGKARHSKWQMSIDASAMLHAPLQESLSVMASRRRRTVKLA